MGAPRARAGVVSPLEKSALLYGSDSLSWGPSSLLRLLLAPPSRRDFRQNLIIPDALSSCINYVATNALLVMNTCFLFLSANRYDSNSFVLNVSRVISIIATVDNMNEIFCIRKERILKKKSPSRNFGP